MSQFACKKALALTAFSVLIPMSWAWALTGESFKAYKDLKVQSEQKDKVEKTQRQTEAEIERNKVTEENVVRILKAAFEKQSESVGEIHSLEIHILGLASACAGPKRAYDCTEEIEAAFAYQNSKEACQGEQIQRAVINFLDRGAPTEISYLRVSCVNRISLNERKVWIVLDESESPAIKEILLKQDKRKL